MPATRWRSPLVRATDRLAARCVAVGDSAVAVSIGEAATESARARAAGFADLCALPRIGLKGTGASAFLAADGWRLPAAPNAALAQDDGAIVARLGAEDFLLYGGARVLGLAERRDASALARRGWIVPRRDGLAWIALAGEHAATLLSKLCAVDLRPAYCPPGTVAQTVVAKVSAIVVLREGGAPPRYDLFVDSASALYLWDCLADAAAEFGGGPVGAGAPGIDAV